MQVELEAGRYVLAVSGGVDSMALLHRLHREPGVVLTVAHLDHGIRRDSADDRRLVQRTARRYGLPFVYQTVALGAGASEAAARAARYTFLHGVRRASGAQAIVTGHHQDDVLETAIINILRGSGRKGLTALSSRHDIRRPLLKVPKQAVVAYAKAHHLEWHEDSTNQDQGYLRNYVRQQLLPRFDESSRSQLLQLITNLQMVNTQIDALLSNYLHVQSIGGRLERLEFNRLSHAEAREIMAGWLRAHDVRSFDRPMLERLTVAAKVARPGSQYDVLQGVKLDIGTRHLALHGMER